jgi:hypothetical protein
MTGAMKGCGAFQISSCVSKTRSFAGLNKRACQKCVPKNVLYTGAFVISGKNQTNSAPAKDPEFFPVVSIP